MKKKKLTGEAFVLAVHEHEQRFRESQRDLRHARFDDELIEAIYSHEREFGVKPQELRLGPSETERWHRQMAELASHGFLLANTMGENRYCGILVVFTNEPGVRTSRPG